MPRLFLCHDRLLTRDLDHTMDGGEVWGYTGPGSDAGRSGGLEGQAVLSLGWDSIWLARSRS